MKQGDYEEIPIKEGEIVKICPDGKIERHRFHYRYYNTRGWWEYGYGCCGQLSSDTTDSYINAIKSVAQYQGIPAETIDEMLNDGFTPEEVEEYLYEEYY